MSNLRARFRLPHNISTTPTPQFSYIREYDDDFIALFPHRFDYIYASHPLPHQSPNWYTESRYPLSDRQLQQGEFLFGVRFGKQTQYCLLDIDIESPYHPQQDSHAIQRILNILEPLGLTSHLTCTSSDSGGLHLYFPLLNPASSWQLAAIISIAITNGGFHLKPGWLELFPNPRPYCNRNHPALFHGHRLPLQIGSYLLNQAYQPTWTDPHQFVRQWKLAQSKNHVDLGKWQHLLKQFQTNHDWVTGKAAKFLKDLTTEIEQGWTGYGQTNRLLGRIALRAYVFGHIEQGCPPLTGNRLTNQIITTARQLPGYTLWCQHQHEIEKRAEEWARSVESSRYFPYCNKPINQDGIQNQDLTIFESNNEVETNHNWNHDRSQQTRIKIQHALSELISLHLLPDGITARYHALLPYGIGGSSLYRHRDLWHPSYLVRTDRLLEVTNETTETEDFIILETTEGNDEDTPSLLCSNDGDALIDAPFTNLSSDQFFELSGFILCLGSIHYFLFPFCPYGLREGIHVFQRPPPGVKTVSMNH